MNQTQSSGQSTLTSLTEIASQISAGQTVTINEVSVGTDAYALFQQFFPGNVSVLTHCTLISSSPSQLFFSGIFSDIFFQSNVQADCFLFDHSIQMEGNDTTERELVLLLTLPATCSPDQFLTPYTTVTAGTDLFSLAGEVPFFSAKFVKPLVLFSSTGVLAGVVGYPALLSSFLAAEKTLVGTYFSVAIEVDGGIGAILTALSLPLSITLDAYIKAENVLNLYLQKEISASSAFGPFSFAVKSIELLFDIANLGQTVPAFRLETHVDFGVGTADVTANLDLVYRLLQINADGLQVQIPSPEAFAEQFGIGSFATLLPGNVADYGSFSILLLEADISLADQTVNRISFGFATQNAVALIDDVLTFRPMLSAEVLSPFDGKSRAVNGNLSGSWQLGSSMFDLSLSSDFDINASLSRGSTIDVTALTEKIFGEMSLPDIVIADLELTGSFKDKSFEAEIDVITDWSLTLGGANFGITEIDMNISYEQKKLSGCCIEGNLMLFDEAIEIYATYDETEGWYLEGGTIAANQIQLGALLEKAAATFIGSSADTTAILDSVSALTIENLYVQYAVTEGSLSVYTELDHVLAISDKLSINTILINLDIKDKHTTGSCTVKLTLAGVDLYLESQKADSGWTFSGGTAPGESIPIGNLANDILSYFDLPFPTVLDGTTLSNLAVTFNTSLGVFSISCDGKILLTNGEIDIHLEVDLKSGTGGFTKEVTGYINIDSKQFAFKLSDDLAIVFVASFTEEGTVINLQQAVSNLSTEIASLIPDDFSLTLNSAVIGILKDQSGTHFLMGVDLGISASLTNIPLVGSMIPADDSLQLSDLKLYFASANFTADQVKTMSSALLPQSGMDKGFLVNSDLVIGTSKTSLALPVTSAPEQTSPSAPTAPVAASPGKWWSVQRSVGPLTVNRIGVKYEKGILWIMLDAVLSTGGLKIALNGLSAGSPLKSFDLHFQLDGLGISYNKGPVNISGALLSVTPDPASGATYQYEGDIIIQTEALTLAAIGAYSDPGGKPSFFVFGEMDKELGGPPYLFVTGLSAGFGYNSKINNPAIDEVVNFPLVQGLQGQTDPLAVLNIMEGGQGGKAWVEGLAGNDWLAFGMQFESFELVQSHALLLAEFGEQFELSLLGISKVQLPQDKSSSPYAFVQMGLEAVLLPESGFFGLSAVISDNSFVITPNCKLSGGFALYTWFGSNAHSGDFVLTVGGYHPAFSKPGWYPDVNALGFSWNVSDDVTISGDAYFALTPSCVMAGGGLQILFQDGNLNAWFNAYADFLIFWKPFHFIAEIGVSIGVSYRVDFLFIHKTFGIELGASLTIWGPPTGGKVHIDWFIISFTIHFGDDESDGTGYMLWPEFSTLLPAEGDICKLKISGGLLSMSTDAGSKQKRWIVRPDKFIFSTHSAIPASELQIAVSTDPTKNKTFLSAAQIDIRPMGLSLQKSIHILTVTGPLGIIDVQQTGWLVQAQSLNAAESLWGEPLPEYQPPTPSANVIPGLNTGFVLVPPSAVLGASAGPIDMKKDLSYESLNPGVLSLSVTDIPDPSLPEYSTETISTIASTIADPIISGNRKKLFDALTSAGIYNGPNDDMSVFKKEAGNIFTAEPLMVSPKTN